MSGLYPDPTWRWLRAIELVDAQARPSRKDDETVVRACKFLRRKRSANVTRLRSLEEDYPDIFAANKVYEEEDQDRWMLEACLCTEAPRERIASDNAIRDVKIIKTYEELFYDVRGYLTSPIYLNKYIIYPALRNRSMEECSPDFMQKVIALMLGYDSLLDSWRIGHESPELTKRLMLAKDNRMRGAGVEAAFTAPINRYTSLELIDRSNAIDERMAAGGPGSQDAAVSAVAEIIKAVTFRKRTREDVAALGADGLEPRSLENME